MSNANKQLATEGIVLSPSISSSTWLIHTAK